MANRAQIKTYFQTNDKPTEAQFEEWLDSIFFGEDDPVVLANTTTPLTTEGEDGNFFLDLAAGKYYRKSSGSWGTPTDIPGVPADNSITTAKLANGAATADKIGTNAVTTVKIENGAVTNTKLADDSVSTDKIVDGSTTLDKMASGTANKLIGYDGSGEPSEIDIKDEDDHASDSATEPASQQSTKAYADNNKVQPISSAPVDGTTVAHFQGQLFWDRAGKRIYEALTASTAPLTAGAGSTFAEIVLGGEVVATTIDASAGAYSQILDAATGTGKVLFFVTSDLTNGATLSVQPGETLNGVTDGTFNFSNYAAGTQFRADDVTGGWVVSVVGASTQTDLHYAQTNVVNGITPQAVGGEIDLDNAIHQVDDPFGLIDGSANAFVIQQSGRYQLFGHYYAPQAGFMHFVVNNVNVATTRQSGTPATIQGAVSNVAEFDLAVGDEVSFTVTSPSNLGATFGIRQLPTTESVLAGTVTPEALAYGRMTLNGATGTSNDMGTVGSPTTAVYESADFSDDITANPATGEFTIIKSGKYRPKAFHSAENRNDDIYGMLFVDGLEVERILWQIPGTTATGALFEFAKRSFSVGQVVTFRLAGPTSDDVADQNRDGIVEFFEMEQFPNSTVVMPAASEILVNDQANSGYMDIGTRREQWGTTTINHSDTVNFPVPFASAPSMVMVTAKGAPNARHHAIYSETSSGFTVSYVDPNNTVLVGAAEIYWQAIGLKP